MSRVHPALTLTLAVAVNSLSVAIQGRSGALTRAFGQSGWLVHAAIVLPAWAWFLLSVSAAPQSRHRVPAALALAGLVGEGAGLALVAPGFRRLGPAAAVNGDLFGLVQRKRVTPVWGVVKDPIYTGYAAWLAGWALRTGRLQLLPVAAQMLALLTLEARIEDWAARRRHV
jgi:protein-S-isoprenylcysteine O-methyltransferase Ste14